MGFEGPSYQIGKLAGQNGWHPDRPTTVSAQVQSVQARSGSQAVELNSAITNNLFYPKIDYEPPVGELVLVECDIARSISATASFGYLIEVFGTNGAKIARAGLGVSEGQIRAVRTLALGTAPVNTTIFAPLQWAHFEMRLNFAVHTWDLFVDGALAAGALPMLNQTAKGIADADLQVATFNASTDTGYFDNYVVRTVPAPGGGGIALALIGGFAAARRRRAERARSRRTITPGCESRPWERRPRR